MTMYPPTNVGQHCSPSPEPVHSVAIPSLTVHELASVVSPSLTAPGLVSGVIQRLYPTVLGLVNAARQRQKQSQTARERANVAIPSPTALALVNAGMQNPTVLGLVSVAPPQTMSIEMAVFLRAA
jgi:hypothetical protein